MNREEIIKIFVDNNINTGYGVVKTDATKLAKIWNEHEQDTLKEFAMYVTGVYFQRKFFRDNYTVDEILLMLNKDIENFIKEKSDE